MRRARPAILSLLATTCAFAFLPGDAAAGMPSVGLSDIARMRIEVVSFFLVVIVLVAWAVKGLWNALQRDFTRLPRLRYKHALALVLLWGLAFNLVLVMISGARELMTPGAWARDGLTYELDSQGAEGAE